MKQKYILWSMILFVFLLLFPFTSLTLIPGDFGSANNGSPDGCVDFEDLMIFALAYGSTPSDPNWNEVCDIAGPGGTLTPDGVIDFEDLMIFAMHYGECENCTPPSPPTLYDPGTTLQSPATYTVNWSAISGATSYVLQESTSYSFSGVQEYTLSGTSRSFSHTVSNTTTYYYRVAAINDCGQSNWSNVENIKVIALSLNAKWTVMVYMSADQSGSSSLDSVAWLDLEEMESVGSTDQVKIVVQLDPYDSCSGTYRYYITGVDKGSSYPLYPDDIVGNLSEQDMSDPSVLANFVNWATNNYPADHYLLVLWDHGGGWKKEDIINKGIMWDYTPGYGYMSMEDLVDGLDLLNEHIDIIGFDACLMQMIEVAYQIESGVTDASNYIVGSEESIWSLGWNYDDILNHLTLNPTMSAVTLCETIVDDFLWDSGVTTATLSVIDLNNFHSIADSIFSNFQLALRNSSYQSKIANARTTAQNYSDPNFKDIYDFTEQIYMLGVYDCQTEADAVMNFVDNVVVYEGCIGLDVVNSHGLSIYLPDTAAGYDSAYSTLLFAINTQWDEFLKSGGGIVPPSSVYRAYLVGIGDYQYFPDAHGNIDLQAPPFDVDMMDDTLSHSGSGFYLINKLIDLQATKEAILNGIASAFAEADEDDVSYFYFSGHGMYYNGVSYLCPTDISYYSSLSSYISTDELETALSVIPGTKVVILDCCHSGGFLGKQMQEEEIFSNAQEFNNNVINVFLSRDLTGSQYKVLTSCLSSQVCVELTPSEGNPFGLFSAVLCEGCGYDSYTHPYPADGNGNGEITLHEAYTYTDEQVTIIATELNYLYGWNIDQDTQVYPLYSDFVIIEE